MGKSEYFADGQHGKNVCCNGALCVLRFGPHLPQNGQLQDGPLLRVLVY